MMKKVEFHVCCMWDDEASLWYVHESNVPGLSAEAPTVEAMEALLDERIPELLRLNRPELFKTEAALEVPFDLVARRHRDLKLAHA
jgi:hypothetical protein